MPSAKWGFSTATKVWFACFDAASLTVMASVTDRHLASGFDRGAVQSLTMRRVLETNLTPLLQELLARVAPEDQDVEL